MNIGLIADESKKTLMQNFCIAYKRILSRHNLYATETTAIAIEQVANLIMHKYLSGQLGGVQQFSTQIMQNELDALLFFRDPSVMERQECINMIKLCDTYSIPFATNLASAEILILAIDRGDLDYREIYK